MNLQNKTTAELEARNNDLIRLTSSLAEWHNRNMSKKDRELFASAYRQESNEIITELMRRES